MKWNVRSVIRLISPILAFPVLYIPYALLNSAVIVDWLGCGCPIMDESGNMVHDYFSANDFTRLFWVFLSLCVTVIAVVLSKRIIRGKKWLRVPYIIGMFGISLFLSYPFIQMMLWS